MAFIVQQYDATWEEAANFAREHGYDLLDLLSGAKAGEDVMIVKCRACGKQTAERPGDVAFGCTCGGKV